MASTLFLMPEAWDLAIDADGNIATATSTYQKAQDICTNIRVFYGDKYYDQDAGIAYLEKVLSKTGSYPLSLFQQKAYEMANNVDGVSNVQISLEKVSDNTLNGTISFIDDDTNITGTITL